MPHALLEMSASLAPEYAYCGAIDNGRGAELLIADGERATEIYPEDPEELLIHLDPARGGPKLASRLGNTRRLLIMAREAIERLADELELGALELYPFTLVNHKRRVHSRDYVIVNPLERRAIAHEATVFERFESTGRIFDCERWVLAASSLDGVPDLLRAAELPRAYFVSERFVEAVVRLGLSNFAFAEVEHR